MVTLHLSDAQNRDLTADLYARFFLHKTLDPPVGIPVRSKELRTIYSCGVTMEFWGVFLSNMKKCQM